MSDIVTYRLPHSSFVDIHVNPTLSLVFQTVFLLSTPKTSDVYLRNEPLPTIRSEGEGLW